MILLDLLQFTGEAITLLIVNKTERGNTHIIFPVLLGSCWMYQVRLHYRKRRWMKLSPREQVLAQQLANETGRRDEPYPL